jgi:lysosomal Pro-X carboxypeptidase
MIKILLAAVICATYILGQVLCWSADNCTWQYFEQPLSHFSRGSTGGRTFQQRLCIYDKFWSSGPVFFYTGNESPVEEYVNNSGFMWNLAEKYNALVVFAEHRYFGGSVPEIAGVQSCMSYLSSQEALADYIAVVNFLRRERGAEASPVVTFGGSYGGMLSAWMRILFPSSVDGAIAASAPILGFPLDSCPLDSSARAVTAAASETGGASAGCTDNLKSAYVLISDIGKTAEGRNWLNKELDLCTPLQSTIDIQAFLSYLQSPLFNLAEGSYPFPSDYITFALTGSNDPLPACKNIIPRFYYILIMIGKCFCYI